MARNLALIAPYWDIHDRLPLAPDQIAQVATLLTRLVTRCQASLASLAAQGDDQCGYGPGTCLTIAYHLLARKQWVVDLLRPLHPGRPLILLCSPGEVADEDLFR